jgi:hypothetical protein
MADRPGHGSLGQQGLERRGVGPGLGCPDGVGERYLAQGRPSASRHDGSTSTVTGGVAFSQS